MSKNSIRKTFLLRGIDPVELHNQYLQLVTRQLVIPREKSELVQNIRMDYPIGKGKDDDVYECSDSDGNIRRIFTTNIFDYAKVKKEGDTISYEREAGNESEMTKCEICGKEIQKCQSLGIPYQMEVIKEDNRCTQVIFYVEGSFCSFEHLDMMIKRHTLCRRSLMKPSFQKVSINSKIMFHLMYPDKKYSTVSSNEYLLKDHGGSLHPEDYDDGKHVYVEMPGVVILPCKRQYLKTRLPQS